MALPIGRMRRTVRRRTNRWRRLQRNARWAGKRPEQDEHPRNYAAELEDEEEATPPAKNGSSGNSLGLCGAAGEAADGIGFFDCGRQAEQAGRNRERRGVTTKTARGCAVGVSGRAEPKLLPLDESAKVPPALSGNFLDIIFSCPYRLHELTANRFLSQTLRLHPSVMNRRYCITCSSSNTAPQACCHP